ncbi:MAG: hypothetical protein JWN67_2232 [Actinomycetia bacterium]|nr:hypothetical protein [Actinomycetes bacterium]
MSRLDDERGFSLTEVAVAAALLMVVLLPLLRFFDSAISGATELQASTQLHADGRSVVDRLARELRQAYTGDPNLPPVTVAADQLSITFYSPDTSTPFRLRRVAYRIQPVQGQFQLQRSTTSSGQTSCPETLAACTPYGPPWTFGTSGPWVGIMDVRTGPAFTAHLVGGAVRTVDIRLSGVNSRGRADRLFQTSIDMRNE